MHRNLVVLLRTGGDATLEKIMQPISPLPPQETLVSHYTTQYPPLERITKPNLTTAECAFYLNRQPQTLRGWACHEDGPLRPVRIGGLLAWSTATVKELTGVISAEGVASK